MKVNWDKVRTDRPAAINGRPKATTPQDEIELAFYLQQVQRFLDNLYQDMAENFHVRGGGEISSELAFVFFNSKERYDNLKALLQYLVYFVKSFPGRSGEVGELKGPYAQFRSLVQRQVDLLLEVDVRIAILRESMQTLPLKEANLERLDEKIDEQHLRFCGQLDAAEEPTPANLLVLFSVLQQFCRFWFDLKRHQHQRVRRSDFYIFKLANLLIDKFLAAPSQPALN